MYRIQIYAFFLLITQTSLFSFVTSVKALGMAGTGVAFPMDSLSAAYNPANISFVPNRVDCGFASTYQMGRCTIKNSIATLPPPLGFAPIVINGTFRASRGSFNVSPDLGITRSLGNDGRWTVGLCLYNKGHVRASYGNVFPVLGRTPLTFEVIQEVVSATCSFRHTNHSFGGSINLCLQSLEQRGLENLDTPLFTEFPGYLTGKGRSLSTGVSLSLGWIGSLANCTQIGLAWESHATMKHFSRYKGFLQGGGRLDQPHKLSFGVAHALNDRLSLLFDLQYLLWNGVKAAHFPATTGVFDLIFNKLGSSTSSGFGWRNQLFYRLGMNLALSPTFTGRIGYRYARSEIPSDQTVNNIMTLDTVEHILACGGSWLMNSCLELSFYYAFGLPKKIVGSKTSPPEFGGGTFDIKNTKHSFGLSLGHNW